MRIFINNIEIILFLDAVMEFREAENDLARSNQLPLIVSTFIKQGAPSELNISGETRSNILNAFFQTYTTPTCAIDIFDKVTDELLLQLQSEQFPPFLTSSYYLNAKQNAAAKQKAEEDDAAKISASVLNEIADFSKPVITEDDFKQMERIMRGDASVWKLLVKKPDVSVYCSKSKFRLSDKNKGLRMMKIVEEFDFNARTLHIESSDCHTVSQFKTNYLFVTFSLPCTS